MHAADQQGAQGEGALMPVLVPGGVVIVLAGVGMGVEMRIRVVLLTEQLPLIGS